VKWCRENYHHDLGCPYSLRLASADASGRIIVWDVSQGISLSDFADGSKPVLDLHWLWTQDASHDLLAALHAPSSLVLWNADTGIKLWKKTFQETLICFAFDPFSPAKVTRTCCDWV
jgi:WD40 repeat protein